MLACLSMLVQLARDGCIGTHPLVSLTLSDMCTAAVVFLLGVSRILHDDTPWPANETSGCTAIFVVRCIFSYASMLSVASFSARLVITLHRRISPQTDRRLCVAVWIVSGLTPLMYISALARRPPQMVSDSTHLYLECWAAGHAANAIMDLIVPWFSLLALAASCWKCSRHLRCAELAGLHRLVVRNSMRYAAAFGICWMPLSVARVMWYSSGEDWSGGSRWALLFAVGLTPLAGFCNSFVYWTNRRELQRAMAALPQTQPPGSSDAGFELSLSSTRSSSGSKACVDDFLSMHSRKTLRVSASPSVSSSATSRPLLQDDPGVQG